jgi:uncharacterized protein (DUF302 family)
MRAIETRLDLPLDQAKEAVRARLATEGFGVLSEIDVGGVLSEKLGEQREPLVILGACNPVLADRALAVDRDAALVLPCNVVLSVDERGGTKVRAVDPRDLLDGADLGGLGEEAAGRLRRALSGS